MKKVNFDSEVKSFSGKYDEKQIAQGKVTDSQGRVVSVIASRKVTLADIQLAALDTEATTDLETARANADFAEKVLKGGNIEVDDARFANIYNTFTGANVKSYVKAQFADMVDALNPDSKIADYKAE